MPVRRPAGGAGWPSAGAVVPSGVRQPDRRRPVTTRAVW